MLTSAPAELIERSKLPPDEQWGPISGIYAAGEPTTTVRREEQSVAMAEPRTRQDGPQQPQSDVLPLSPSIFSEDSHAEQPVAFPHSELGTQSISRDVIRDRTELTLATESSHWLEGSMTPEVEHGDPLLDDSNDGPLDLVPTNDVIPPVSESQSPVQDHWLLTHLTFQYNNRAYVDCVDPEDDKYHERVRLEQDRRRFEKGLASYELDYEVKYQASRTQDLEEAMEEEAEELKRMNSLWNRLRKLRGHDI